jgi:hypothetical protein
MMRNKPVFMTPTCRRLMRRHQMLLEAEVRRQKAVVRLYLAHYRGR